MKVVVAPDKFAGTMTASTAAHAIGRGWARGRPGDDIALVPIADGGEGMIDVIATTVPCRRHAITVTGPLGDPISAEWLELEDGRAIIEAAGACGLRHVPADRRDPLRATTAGVGQLLLAAAESEMSEIVVGLGGSATVDGGAGMAAELGLRMLDRSGRELDGTVGSLTRLDRVEGAARRIPAVVAAVDVNNPLLGPDGAASVFGPQKGADEPAVKHLEDLLRRLADVVERDLPGGPWRQLPGSGAAGGLAFALAAVAAARLAPGAAVVAELIGLPTALRGADAVVTGEGSLDEQTLRGKGPDYVRRLGREAGASVVAVAGSATTNALAAFDAVETLGPEGLLRPVELTEQAAYRLAAAWRRRPPSI